MIKSKIFIALLVSILHLPSEAGEVDIPNSFSAGTRAVAADVNANFNAVETAVDGNAVDIAALLATVTAMEARLATLETDNSALNTQVAALEEDVALLQTDNATLVADNALMQNFIAEVVPYVEGGNDAQGNQAIFYSGVNVYVNNGAGATNSVNGTGNLILGYNEAADAHRNYCNVADAAGSAYTTAFDCDANGGVWDVASQKSGSHNLIVGLGHNYTQTGGLISGENNTLASSFSSITGGTDGIVSSRNGGISGGLRNRINGRYGSISAGQDNLVEGTGGSVSGGFNNQSISGFSSIGGGRNNVTLVNSTYSSVSGGNTRTTLTTDSWAAGGLSENN